MAFSQLRRKNASLWNSCSSSQQFGWSSDSHHHETTSWWDLMIHLPPWLKQLCATFYNPMVEVRRNPVSKNQSFMPHLASHCQLHSPSRNHFNEQRGKETFCRVQTFTRWAVIAFTLRDALLIRSVSLIDPMKRGIWIDGGTLICASRRIKQRTSRNYLSWSTWKSFPVDASVWVKTPLPFESH